MTTKKDVLCRVKCTECGFVSVWLLPPFDVGFHTQVTCEHCERETMGKARPVRAVDVHAVVHGAAA